MQRIFKNRIKRKTKPAQIIHVSAIGIVCYNGFLIGNKKESAMQGKIQRIIKNEMQDEMQNNNAISILAYAKTHKDTFEKGGVSSNEISYFDFDGKKYILKSPLMVGENLSPFWRMMKNVFRFTFEKQNAHLHELYNVLKNNDS